MRTPSISPRATGDPLVARSSSVLEDTAGSSMAGQFDSVIGITGFEEFVDAVPAVLDSRARAGVAGSPIAVLVQPLIEPRYGGVLFGVDPVTGRTDRRMVSAVEGGPEPLVSGEVDGSRYVLDTDARVVDFTQGDGPELPATDLRGLVALSEDVGACVRRPAGRRVGDRRRRPPVAPAVPSRDHGDPWRPGGSDLWARARSPRPSRSRSPSSSTTCGSRRLRDAVREAVLLAGIATRKEVAASEVIVSIAGHVAIDLRLAGEIRAEALAPAEAEPGSRRCAGCAVRGRSVGSAPRCPPSPSSSSTGSTATSRRRPRCPSSPAGSSSRCSTAATACSGRCTRTRSSWACSPTPAATG